MKTVSNETPKPTLPALRSILAFLTLLPATLLPLAARAAWAASPIHSSPVAAAFLAESSQQAADNPIDDGILMRWSTPTPSPQQELVAWHNDNAPRLAAVEHAWGDLLRRMSGHRPGRFDAQCLALSSSLADFDRSDLLPVPDPLIDLYVKRLLKHLHAATQACRTQQLFNVVYRLEEARAALAQVRWFVGSRRGLDLPTALD